MLEHFAQYRDYVLLQMITQDLKMHAAKLECEPRMLQGMMKVVIHAVCVSRADERTWWLLESSRHGYRYSYLLLQLTSVTLTNIPPTYE